MNKQYNKFPYNINYKNIQYDEEGLWSITLPNDADNISKIIIKELNKNSILIDGTCGLGGNILSFAKYFKKVIGIEINNNRFKMLLNNIKLYNLNNIYLINDNCINFICNLKIKYDGIFIDPPWGGPNYKYINKLRLTLGSHNLITIIRLIKKINNIKIFMKLPFNYDLTEFYNLNYKIYKINNFILIIIY